jgi:RNA polymerase sigma-70 factor, ECF subfamily
MSVTINESFPNLLPGMLPRLRTFSLRLCGDRHDAEDLLQRSCVRGLERVHQLEPGTAPLSWMFSIVQSTWINELRARRVRSGVSFDVENQAITPSGASMRGPDDVLFCRQILAAVERLPEAQRLVMLLVAIEGLSYAEAAKVLDVPVGTVMSRLSRARQRIGATSDGRSSSSARSAPRTAQNT